jgi:hypothetical protein
MAGLEIKGCPWCGGQPQHEVFKVHNCGEPYFTVRLGCKPCGVSMSATSRDSECDAASSLNQKRYAKGEPLVVFADAVAHIVVKDRLLPRWNTRAPSTPQPPAPPTNQP